MDVFGKLVSRHKFGCLKLVEILCEFFSWKNSGNFKLYMCPCVCIHLLFNQGSANTLLEAYIVS